jgi:ABC-type uncharacterized transport system fused permease/ATPase subunit
MTSQRRWRAWLNNHILDRWLQNGRYYQLNLVGRDHQNPGIPHRRRRPGGDRILCRVQTLGAKNRD